jgi:hypothetical protein
VAGVTDAVQVTVGDSQGSGEALCWGPGEWGVVHGQQAGVVLAVGDLAGDGAEAGLDHEVTDGAQHPVVVDEVGHALAGVAAVAREDAGDAIGVQSVEVLEPGRP